MTEETKERYNEDKAHFEVIRAIIKEEMRPTIRQQNWFFALALSCFAFFFGTIIVISKDVQAKADSKEVEARFKEADKTYMEKFDYYQIEVDGHRVMKEIIRNPAQADYLMDVINDNIASKLGFKYTTRGGEK